MHRWAHMNSKIKDISTNASLVMKIINANLTPPKKQPFKVKSEFKFCDHGSNL